MSEPTETQKVIEQQFEKFYKKIKLKSKQNKDAKKRYRSVCKTLHKHYYTFKYNGSTKFLFGSYGKKTNIRPPGDVDVLFLLPETEFERYDSYKSNGQAQLLQDIRKLISVRFPTKEVIKAWGKVILVESPKGKHNVEILPGFKRSGNIFVIPNSENGGTWEEFDPKTSKINIRKQNSITNGLTRKLIRVTKHWAFQTSTLNLKSHIIEKYVLDYLNGLSSIDDLFSILFLNLLKAIKKVEKDKSIISHIETAIIRAEKAIKYADEEKTEDAIDEWQKIFGIRFPRTIGKAFIRSINDEQINQLRLLYPSKDEEYLDKKYSYTFNLDKQYSFEIDAYVKQDGFRTHFLSLFLHKKWVLHKNKSLIFKVIKNTVPKPYVIYWKIRNFGDEAATKGQLRGEIKKGSKRHEESTLYEGEHFVECYCVKNNVCVAMDRIFVPILKTYE